MKTNNVRKITDGSIIIAIYLIFLLCNKMIGGLIEQSLFFLIPLPLCIYGYKYSLKENLITSFAVIIASFIIIDPFSTLMYVLPCIIIGLIYPLILKRKIKYLLEITLITIFFLISELLTSVIFGYIFNYDIIEDTKTLITIISNLFPITTTAFLESIIISLIPLTLFLISVLEAILLSLLLRMILIHLKYIPKSFKLFISTETLPKSIGFIYLLMIPLMIVSLQQIPYKNSLFILYSIILNIGIVYSFFIIYQGMYLISKYSFFVKKRYIFFISILILLFCPIIILIIGILQSTLSLSHKII